MFHAVSGVTAGGGFLFTVHFLPVPLQRKRYKVAPIIRCKSYKLVALAALADVHPF